MIMIRYHHMERQFSSIFLGVWVVTLVLLPLWRLTLDFTALLLTLVLGIFFVYRLARWIGTDVVAVATLGIIVLHAQWGLAQFVVQQDLGMYILGESRIDSEHVAVAKFSAFGGKLVRAYGPYAHANSFGGAMVGGLMLASYVMAGRSVRQDHERLFWLGVILVLTLAVLVSFSRAAYLGAAILVPAFLRGRVQLWQVPLVGFIGVILFLPLVYQRFADVEDRGISDRVSQLYVWRELVKQQPWWTGMGVGQYPDLLEHWLQQRGTEYETWEIAPVHSAPLLAIAEWGWLLATTVTLGVGWWLRGVDWKLAAIVPPFLFDHYFLTQLSSLVWLITLTTLWVVVGRRRRSLQLQ